MEYWQSYYANYTGYPPCPPSYPCPPRDQSSFPSLLPECSLSGASHLRVASDTDSDSGSPSRDLRRPNQIHTSASKHAATSCSYNPGKSEMAMPQSEVSIDYDVCVRESVLVTVHVWIINFVHVGNCLATVQV